MARVPQRTWVLMPVLAFALAGCGGTQTSTVISSVGEGPTVVAANNAFDRAEIEIPADQAVGLRFENRDSVPHNVAIFADASATQAIFTGDIVSGPGSTVYALPPLPAGSYPFRCDVHQDMKGTLLATP